MKPLDVRRLRTVLDQTTRAALASGALAPIVTDALEREDGGVVFSIRRVSTITQKARTAQRANDGAPKRNPFLDPDPELLLGAIGEHHVALLNKYPVLDHHFLIVTRAFAPQEELVSEDDFAALLPCLEALPSLGFYNGGRAAGASQPHKHLQVVPLPLGSAHGAPVPIAPLLDRAESRAGLAIVPAFAFRHAFARAPAHSGFTAPTAVETFRRLVDASGVRAHDPYNLLMTPEWMLVVARSKERCEGVSVNALGFAGSFFVAEGADLETFSRRGPLSVLHEVAVR